MRLFYYTEVTPPAEGEEVAAVPEFGYSFDLDSILLTYPSKDGISVVLNRNADKLTPVEYQYKTDPKTKQRYPIKVSKFENTSEPIVINLTKPEDIKRFFEETGGPVVPAL